jgi:hypothetical protein
LGLDIPARLRYLRPAFILDSLTVRDWRGHRFQGGVDMTRDELVASLMLGAMGTLLIVLALGRRIVDLIAVAT